MKRITIILISILIIFSVIFLFTRRNRDERVIKRNLNILAKTVSKSKEDNNLVLIVKTQKIQSLFANDCKIIIEYERVPKIDNLYELIAFFQNIFRLIEEVRINFYDVSVKISEDKKNAVTLMTAMATGIDPQDNEKVQEAREVKIIWKKIDGSWKISEAQALKTLH